MLHRLFLLSIVASVACFSQEFRSTISGRITDPSGAAVPGVAVVAVEKNTGSRSETSTGAEGEYSLPFLPPGPYTITAERSGFKKHSQEGITVGANQRLNVDVTLQIGSQIEAITVTSDAAMLSRVWSVASLACASEGSASLSSVRISLTETRALPESSRPTPF